MKEKREPLWFGNSICVKFMLPDSWKSVLHSNLLTILWKKMERALYFILKQQKHTFSHLSFTKHTQRLHTHGYHRLTRKPLSRNQNKRGRPIFDNTVGQIAFLYHWLQVSLSNVRSVIRGNRESLCEENSAHWLVTCCSAAGEVTTAWEKIHSSSGSMDLDKLSHCSKRFVLLNFLKKQTHLIYFPPGR